MIWKWGFELRKALFLVPILLEGLSDGALLGAVLELLLLGNADDTVLESKMALTTGTWGETAMVLR